MRVAGRHGVTLLEALLALGVGLAVLGLVITLLSTALRVFARSEERLDPREACRRALDSIRREVTDSVDCATEADGRALVFVSPRGEGRIVHDTARGELVLRTEGRRQQLAAGVEEATFQVLDGGLVSVRLALSRTTRRPRAVSVPVVTAGIIVVVPALLPRDHAVPWRDESVAGDDQAPAAPAAERRLRDHRVSSLPAAPVPP
jgi:hypothetical protein